MLKNHFLILVLIAVLALFFTSAFSETVITMFTGSDQFNWAPTSSMVKSEANPMPHDHIAILAQEWEKLHPGVEIKFVGPSAVGTDWRTWEVTQFSGGTAPDIVFDPSYLSYPSDVQHGWVISLTKYLNEPNPYVSGNKKWKDLFYRRAFTPSANGNYYYVAPDLIGLGILYNEDILAKAGINEPPSTFAQLLDDLQKVKDAGYIPYMSIYPWYQYYMIPLYIWRDKIPEMGPLQDGAVTTEGLTKAYYDGVFNPMGERMKEWLKLSGELYEMYPKGFLSMTPWDPWITGKVAFLEGTTSQMMQSHLYATFKWGVISYPKITTQTTKYGTNLTVGTSVPGYYTEWAVTNTAVKNNVVDLCINWLQFLTTPENDAFLVNETGAGVVGIKGATPLPQYKEMLDTFVKSVESPSYLPWGAFSPMIAQIRFEENFSQIMNLYGAGDISLEVAQSRLAFLYKQTFQTLKEQNNWNF